MPYSAGTLSSMNGFHKDRRAEKLEKLVPKDFHLVHDIPFKKGKKLGRNYLQPVFMTYPHGVTFSASDAMPALNAAVAAETKEASIGSYQVIARERISYDAADRAASDEEAYENETQFLMEALRLSHLSKLEAVMFYGGHANGLGTIATSGVSGNVCTITTAEWAGGIWAGAENMRIDAYNSTTYVKTVSVTSVDLDSLTVTVSNATGLTDGYAFFYEGSYGNTMTGIHQIITNSSSLFGINASTYNLWKGVTQTASSTTLKLLPLMQAGAKARIKGMRGSVKAYVNAFSFVDLVDEIEAARTDGNGQVKGAKYERGGDSMKIHSANGSMEIVVSDFVKRGLAFGLIQDDSWQRIGSSDLTFRYPGTKSEETFIHLQEHSGYEFRSWSNFSAFCSKPGANFVINNIVNSAS